MIPMIVTVPDATLTAIVRILALRACCPQTLRSQNTLYVNELIYAVLLHLNYFKLNCSVSPFWSNLEFENQHLPYLLDHKNL